MSPTRQLRITASLSSIPRSRNSHPLYFVTGCTQRMPESASDRSSAMRKRRSIRFPKGGDVHRERAGALADSQLCLHPIFPFNPPPLCLPPFLPSPSPHPQTSSPVNSAATSSLAYYHFKSLLALPPTRTPLLPLRYPECLIYSPTSLFYLHPRRLRARLRPLAL